jgi:hypothetical protein
MLSNLALVETVLYQTVSLCSPCGRHCVCDATAELIEQARRRMQETSYTREASIVLESLLGEGTFGKVYSGVKCFLRGKSGGHAGAVHFQTAVRLAAATNTSVS